MRSEHAQNTVIIHRTTALSMGVSIILSVMTGGCISDTPMNPSFPLKLATAKAAIEQMHDDRQSLKRPVVVLGGIHDPGFAPSHIADVIRDSVPDSDRAGVIDIAFFETGSFDSCVMKLFRTLDERFPSSDPEWTIEVDVVGFSMGGVVARYAASNTSAARHGRRLRIGRLFTISSPHQGARMAELPTLDRRVKDMRPDSLFLQVLNSDAASTAFPIFAYVRLDDAIVGSERAALPGEVAWWVPSGATLAHTLAAHDPRLLADILRRLRYDEPYSIQAPTELPND